MDRAVWVFGVGLLLAACSGEEKANGGSGGAFIVDGSAGHSHGGANGDEPRVLPPFNGPESLGDTGLYSDYASKTLAPDLLTWDVRFPLWSDGASKKRYMYLPPGTQIDTSWMDVWKFPVGTKAWMEFTFGGKLIETRFSHKKAEGWELVTYLWNEAGTQATAAPAGGKDVLGTALNVPDMLECIDCHGGVGDTIWGFSAIQLSSETGSGQLTELAQQQLFTNPPSAEFAIPGDGVVEQTLGYLHANCGQCHNNQHYLASKRDLRLKLLVSNKLPEETALYTTAIGGKMNHIVDGTTLAVVPGNPLESQLWQRMNRRDDLMGMPAIVTQAVDTEAVKTVGDWITGLSP